jgi:LytS/YehU family sensor histidine kinase
MEVTIVIIVFAVFFFLCIYLYINLSEEKRKKNRLSLLVSKLGEENTQLKSEALKFQLQPHTLRNMVATLHVAAKNLYRGSEALADALDYVLLQRQTSLVSVQEEIEFLESYKYLQTFYLSKREAIQIDTTQIDDKLTTFSRPCIPHLITAHFIENAFKHGDIQQPDFLKISIKLTPKAFEYTVVNRIKNEGSKESRGVGLQNMQKRLELMVPGRFEIKHSCNEYEYHAYLKIQVLS